MVAWSLGYPGTRAYSQTSRLRFEHVDFEEELPQNSVYAIAQDKTGFMWFGTADGLCRYDGRELKIYRHDPADDNSLPGNFVRSIFPDSKGRLWVGTESGLCCYFPEFDRFRRVVVPEFRGKEGATFARGECKNGETFFVGQAWQRIDPESWTIKSASPTQAMTWIKDVSPYSTHSIGNRAVFSRENSLHFYDWNNRELDSVAMFGLGLNAITSAVLGPNDLFLGTGDGIIVFNLLTQKGKWLREIAVGDFRLSIGTVKVLLLSPWGELLIGTSSNGVLAANASLSMATQYLPSPSAPHAITHPSIESLFYDRNGNLWIGTDSHGIEKASGNHRFDHFGEMQNGRRFLPSSHIHCFAIDDEGYLFVGTHGGLAVISPDRTSAQIYAADPNGIKAPAFSAVNCILIDSHKRVWIGTTSGIAQFERQSGKLDFISSADNRDQQPISMIETENGNILVGTRSTTTLFDPATQKFLSLSISPSIWGISNFKYLDDGVICGTRKYTSLGAKGIFEVKRLNEFERTLIFSNSRDCASDEENHIWLASDIGLIKADAQHGILRIYTAEDGLPNSVIYSALPDGKGNLWISSNKGLTKFNIAKETFSNYDLSDGLQSLEFNSNAFYISKRGEVFFGGVNGFNAFFPDSIVDNPLPPAIAITSCRIFHNEYQGDSSINALHALTLPHDQNTLSFTLAPLDFTVPKKNLLMYRLLGLDSNWVHLGNERNLSFIALPPRDYVLQIKGCNNDGTWTTQARELRITIVPPVWKRTWFLVLNGILLFAIFCFVAWYVSTRKLRRRVKQLEREKIVQDERSRIARDMHDDIGAGLSKISLLCEMANQGPDLTDGTKEKLQKVSFSARQIVANMNEIIWSMNPKYDRLDELVSYFHAYAHDFFENLPIRLSFDFPEISVGSTTILDNRMRRNLFFVFKEALNNIAKHSKANNVDISINADFQGFRLMISDDGVGFDVTHLPKFRNGLTNMKTRLEEIDATVEFYSAPQHGTRIEIFCRLDEAASRLNTTKM